MSPHGSRHLLLCKRNVYILMTVSRWLLLGGKQLLCMQGWNFWDAGKLSLQTFLITVTCVTEFPVYSTWLDSSFLISIFVNCRSWKQLRQESIDSWHHVMYRLMASVLAPWCLRYGGDLEGSKRFGHTTKIHNSVIWLKLVMFHSKTIIYIKYWVY